MQHFSRPSPFCRTALSNELLALSTKLWSSYFWTVVPVVWLSECSSRILVSLMVSNFSVESVDLRSERLVFIITCIQRLSSLALRECALSTPGQCPNRRLLGKSTSPRQTSVPAGDYLASQPPHDRPVSQQETTWQVNLSTTDQLQEL